VVNEDYKVIRVRARGTTTSFFSKLKNSRVGMMPVGRSKGRSRSNKGGNDNDNRLEQLHGKERGFVCVWSVTIGLITKIACLLYWVGILAISGPIAFCIAHRLHC